jgi:hypothetical protein
MIHGFLAILCCQKNYDWHSITLELNLRRTQLSQPNSDLEFYFWSNESLQPLPCLLKTKCFSIRANDRVESSGQAKLATGLSRSAEGRLRVSFNSLNLEAVLRAQPGHVRFNWEVIIRILLNFVLFPYFSSGSVESRIPTHRGRNCYPVCRTVSCRRIYDSSRLSVILRVPLLPGMNPTVAICPPQRT